MKIKMARQYSAYKAGEVADVSDDLAVRLIAWGYATEERQQQMEIENASLEQRGESADISMRRRKKP